MFYIYLQIYNISQSIDIKSKASGLTMGALTGVLCHIFCITMHVINRVWFPG